MPDANGKPLRADYDTPSPVLSNTTYDVVKDLVTIAFPAAIVLYSGLAVFWGWPFTEQIVGSAGLIGTFLGVLQKRYEKLPTQYDGALVANDPNPDNDTYRLEFDNSLPAMANQATVRLKVVDLLPPDAQ